MTNDSINFTKELVSLVTKKSFDDLPAATVHKAKMHLLDTLGAALAGSKSPEVSTAFCLVNPVEKTKGAPIWGHALYANARESALLNGISTHAYELDDCGGCDHSGAVVIPAILALLSQLPTCFSGQALLLNMIMGYEVARRILEACGGYELHNGLGWHSTGTCGVFGAAIAAGLTLNLDEAHLVSSLGIAGSQASGTWSFIHDGSQTKKLHAGLAASGGVTSAALAQAGFQGSSSILQPKEWGSYLSAFGQDKGDPQALIDNFGVNWRIDRCSIKPYATCRGTHSAIDALNLLLKKHHLQKASLHRIEVKMSVFQAGMCGAKIIKTRAQAQMSLAYALAAQLTYGQVFLSELSEAAYKNHEIQGWLARITIITDSSMADADEPEIALITTDMKRLSASVAHPLGSPEFPLSEEKIIEKFVNLSTDILKPAQIDTLIETILTLDKIQDARALPHALVPAQ